MRYKCVLTIFAMFFLAGLLLSGAPAAQANSCTMASAAGKYGFTLTGLLILPTGPVPIAAVGRVTVDAAGNFSGTESRNVGGGFAEETITGTLTVNPDCTGTVTLNAFEAGHLARTVILATVSDDNQKEVRMVEKSLVLPNGISLPVVITLEAKKTFSAEEND